MAQTQATQDEDLLIISDDTASDTDTSIEISLDDTTPAISLDSEPIIDLDATEGSTDTEAVSVEEDTTPTLDLGLTTPEVLTEETVQNSTETPEVLETETNDVNLWSLDLGISDAEVSEETSWDTVEESSQTEGAEDISFGESIAAASAVAATSVGWEATMNSILSETITKLESRQEEIVSEKDGKSTQVSDLKEQIKKLEEEVALHEWEIQELESEAKKISTNIKWLEKMKLDEDVAKQHNSTRVPKK